MDGEDFHLHWEEGVKWEIKQSPTSEHSETGVICGIENVQSSYNDMQSSEVEIPNTDQMAAENLIFLAQDVNYTVNAELVEDPSVECVTEEVITDDWVITGGQERVEVPLEHLANAVLDGKEDNDIDVPLPTDQDEYTARRPWPCDFCSRRFRKKAALMNHMVAHQNDRPHACNLCGVRYVRKCDLINHLKVHAFVPTDEDGLDFEEFMETSHVVKPKKKRGRRKKVSEPTEESAWENMTSARTQQWSRRARSPKPPPAPPSPSLPPSEPASPPPPSPPPVPVDPSRPFVCKHCGVGFAREKALQSHSRVHGGDSPMECSACGELCWSREALTKHARLRHPHVPVRRAEAGEPLDDSDADGDYTLSPAHDSGSERAYGGPVRGPDLFCQDCGVAFQRADLLRRHQAAAHSYKRERSEGSGAWGAGEHACDVCGEVCADALQLLAHAERHADRNHAVVGRLKKGSRGRTASASSHSRQFPCRECGKVFGSRSSQQIHVRIHTGERPYACRFCWKAFADGGTLRKHERIHTGEKPYACAVCPRAFNQRVVLREHVRSHHSAPTKRPNGLSSTYICVVCGRTLHSSTELVQHLIQHCDVNTALKRQPQPGPRKYKRRRKIKTEVIEPMSETGSWERASPPTATPPPPPVTLRIPRRRRRAPASTPQPPLRQKMIHTEETPRSRHKAKQYVKRGKRPSRRPADDLRAIRSPKLEPMEADADTVADADVEADVEADANGPYKCEMCSLEFPRRDALLLHVPVHI